MARRHFGYAADEVAAALRYRSHGSVRNALLRVEADNQTPKNTAGQIAQELA